MKNFAFVDFLGVVREIETRCSGFFRADCTEGELAIEDIIHRDFMDMYVEILGGQDVKVGMLYIDGTFVEAPEPVEEPIEPTEEEESVEVGDGDGN